jgi:hypothetical protein
MSFVLQKIKSGYETANVYSCFDAELPCDRYGTGFKSQNEG